MWIGTYNDCAAMTYRTNRVYRFLCALESCVALREDTSPDVAVVGGLGDSSGMFAEVTKREVTSRYVNTLSVSHSDRPSPFL